jgi:hypothetical protein
VADIGEEPFQLLGEIQNLGRIMRRCASVHDPEFIAAQTALARAINRLASLPTLRDRSLPGGGGIEV